MIFCSAGVRRDLLAHQLGELRDRQRGVREDPQLRVLEALVVHGPARQLEVAEADVDPDAILRLDAGQLPRGADELGGRALPVAHVEAQDQVGVAEHVLHHAHVERMAAREVEAAVDVVDRRAQRLGELDQGLEPRGVAPDELGEDHRPLRRRDQVRRARQRGRVGGELRRDRHRVFGGSGTSWSSGCSCIHAS